MYMNLVSTLSLAIAQSRQRTGGQILRANTSLDTTLLIYMYMYIRQCAIIALSGTLHTNHCSRMVILVVQIEGKDAKDEENSHR